MPEQWVQDELPFDPPLPKQYQSLDYDKAFPKRLPDTMESRLKRLETEVSLLRKDVELIRKRLG